MSAPHATAPPWAAPAEAAADLALTSGTAVPLPAWGLVVVPDVLVIEATANGQSPPPSTLRLRSPEGRCAYVFRLPEGAIG